MNDKLLEYIKEIMEENLDELRDCIYTNSPYAAYSEGAHKTCKNILNAYEHLKENDNLDDFEEQV